MNDTDHRVHGLAADDVHPDWPPLALAEVAALLDRYPPLASAGAIAWHSPRPLSAAALVDTAGGAVFVKRHHRSVRTPAILAEEHAYMAWLRKAGVPVPAVLADAAGHTAVALGEWTYEVHAPAAGIDLYRETASWTPLPDLAHAHAAGAMLARLHHAAEGYTAGQRGTHLLVARSELIEAADPLAAIAAQLPDRPGLARYLEQRDWRAEIGQALAPFHHPHLHARLATQPKLWTHGDWHVSNLCWSDPGPQAAITDVLDFGLAARTFALFDLATAIERNAIAWLALDSGIAAHPDTVRALVAGYRSRRPLDAADVHLLAELLPLVHLDFALSEVEYFSAVTHAQENADVAYHTFLRGHAAWFATPAGKKLLDAIHALA